MILDTILEFVACGPCVRQYGRWTNQVQSDGVGDSIWNDLTLFNYSMRDETKPPSIPKVVELVQDSDRDISTLCDLQHHHQYRNEHATSQKELAMMLGGFETKVDEDDIDTVIFDDDGTHSLESIMGPTPSRLMQHGCLTRTGPHCSKYHELQQFHLLHRCPPYTKTPDVDDGSSYSSTHWRRPSLSIQSRRGMIILPATKRL